MEPIDWSREWLTSLLWVAKVFGLTIVIFVVVGWLLATRTKWGRQFWRLSGMYFIPYRRDWLSWRPILTVALLLFMTVISVRIDVILSFNSNDLFTALQEQDQPTFWTAILRFSIIATINLVLVLFNFYIGQAQIIHWRLWLNQRMVGDWLNGSAYHRGRFVAQPIDNPDQRIQQDVTSFAGDSQGLALGMVSSMITLVSFTIILWGLSGPLEIWRGDHPAGDGVHRLHLRDHRHGDRLPDRPTADPAQLPQRVADRVLPLRAGPGPGELGEHRLLRRRAGGERRADGPLRRR